jgi:hypothetical protein
MATDEETARAQLEESAREMAEDMDPKDRAGFISDYVEVLSKLNAKLDDIMAGFREEASGIVSSYVQLSPKAVKMVVDKHSNDLSQLMSAFSMMISRVGDEATRTLMAKAARKGIQVCTASVRDLARRNEKRKGVRLS